MQDKQKSTPNAGFSLNLGDIYHVLFRHKWKILAVWLLGAIVSAGVYLKWPIQYSSEAMLFVRYVKDVKDVNFTSGDSQNISSTSFGADSVIRTEMEMMQNLDVAKEAAEILGADMIYKLTGATNIYVAAAIIRNSIVIETAYRSPVMHVFFKHSNPEIVQPVLSQVIQSYYNAHRKIHQVGGQNDSLTMQTDTLRTQLEKLEADLMELKSTNGVDRLADTKSSLNALISKIQEDLWTAETELAEHKAVVASFTNLTTVTKTETNSPTQTTQAPSDKLSEYQSICNRLETLQTRKNSLLLDFQEGTTRVQAVQEQIDRFQKQKTELEMQFPQLKAYQVTSTNPSGQPGKQGIDLTRENMIILALETRIVRLQTHLRETKAQLDKIAAVETKIRDLERERETQEANLNAFKRKLFDEKIEAEMNNGKLSSLALLQQPSPAASDASQRKKIVRGVFLGGLALGLALAFVIEFYFDRSFKRPGEIETKLGLPLFLTIPETTRNGRLRIGGRNVRLLTAGNGHGTNGLPKSEPVEGLIEPEGWRVDPTMQPFFEAFRDRLITHFEITEVNHKPKLVAVTSCTAGSGVSTVASGLAASLSETGEGNVLLVDMNTEKGAAHFFHKGKLDCGLDDVLAENGGRENAQVEKNLFVVTENAADEKLPRILHKRFSALIPKLHASDFDYIIFDMPPVSQTSATTRVARFMDMVFMVVEAEKTDRDVVKRASQMLKDAKATNVGVVLNKSHNYVPGRLNQEL